MYNGVGIKMNKKIVVDCKANELKGEILPLLKGTVFHVTSFRAYQRIFSDRMLKPNIGSQFQYTFPQSEKSYGVKRGYVCLFDLRNKTDEVIKDALMKFYFLNPFHNQNKPIFLILSPTLHLKLIDYTVAKREVGYGEMYIPYVECWYPGSIPLEDIDKIIEVTVECPPLGGI